MSNPLELYQQYVGNPTARAVGGFGRGMFGLEQPEYLQNELGREAYRTGQAVGNMPAIAGPVGAVKAAANLPELATAIGALPFKSSLGKAFDESLKYFHPKEAEYAVREATAGKGKETIVLMRPEDFLASAKPFKNGPEPERLKSIRDAMDENKPLDDIPYLTAFLSKDQSRAKITGHEGRHRAVVFMEKGIPFMPVRLRAGETLPGKGAWGGINYRDMRNEEIYRLPSKVKSETENMKDRSDFFLTNPFFTDSIGDTTR